MPRNIFIKLLLRRETILIIFVATTVVNTLNTDFSAPVDEIVLPILSIVVFPLLAWFTHKHQLLATWCTVLLLIMTGSNQLYESFFSLTHEAAPSILGMLFQAILGIYLTWGGLLLHRERHFRD